MAMKLDQEDLNRLIEKISTSDIQEFSLEGEDFKLEIKRNLSGDNNSMNNLVAENIKEQQLNSTKKTANENISIASSAESSPIPPPGVLEMILPS